MIYRKPKNTATLLSALFALLILLPGAKAQGVIVLGANRLIPADSVVLVAANPNYKKSFLHNILFGKHYRQLWTEPVHAHVFDITSDMGGFKPLKMGGSFQTKNLRLEDKQGKEFVIRSVDKDPSQKLSKRLANSFIGGWVRDQTSVIHPYAYYIVPTLSDAVGINHTNPRLIYIPNDPHLKEFQEEFANMLAMVEERPTGDREEIDSFGNPKKVSSSRSAFAKIYTDPCHRVDAHHFLRSRLFDVWIGDWSRREDQWRWAIAKQNNITRYRAIPRDRDHAFFLLDDGIIPWLFTRFQTDLQSFHHKINNVEGYTRSGRPMDMHFLNYLTAHDFAQIATEMQQALTDEKIREALSVWPENIYKVSGEEFFSKLKARRQQLPKVAAEFYKILAKEVNLPGTDLEEHFIINRLPNGNTKISLYSKSKNCSADSLIGERVFYPKETKLIRIYGLGGEDKIEIRGSGCKAIKLEVYGGEGEDKIVNSDTSKTPEKRTLIFDPDDGDSIKEGKRGKIKEGHKPLAEEYNATGWLLRHRLH